MAVGCCFVLTWEGGLLGLQRVVGRERQRGIRDRLGDRVAVMDGGKLVQHATPAEIIAKPATEFVANMVGDVERPLRLLSLIPVRELVEDGTAEGDPLPAGASLRDALSACLWTGRTSVPVEEDGTPLGRVTLGAIRARAGQHA